MATDLREKPSGSGSDQNNPADRYYDDTFNQLTSPDHMAKDGESGDTGGGFYNPNDDESSDGAGSRGGSHKASRSESAAAGGGLLSQAKGWYNGAKDSKKGFGQRHKGLLKNKWFIGGVIGGSGVVATLIFLIILLASLKIPHLMENIASYQFARISRQMLLNTQKVMADKIAIDSAKQATHGKLATKYLSARGAAADRWSRLDKLRPNKIITNMKANGDVRFNYVESRVLGRPVLDSIHIRNPNTGRTMWVPVQNVTGAKKLVPGFKFANDIRFAKVVAPQINQAVRAQAWGPVVRGIAANNLRKELGINLIAWKVGEYKGKTPKQARLHWVRTSSERVNTKTTTTPRSSKLKDAVKKAEQARADTLKDDKRLEGVIASGGRDVNVEKAVNDSVQFGGATQTALSATNTAYAVAMPLCIIYDGSLEESGGDIDANTEADMKQYHLYASAADQQKHGTDADVLPIGAINDQLGDISGTPPMTRASGQEFDTSGVPSAQASAAGTFSLFNAFFGSNAVVGAFNDVVKPSCGALTNTWVAAGIGVINVAASVLTLGGWGAAQTTLSQAAKVGVSKIVKAITTKLTTKVTVKGLVKGTANGSVKVAGFTGKIGKSVAKVAGLTIIAKMIVASKAGELHSGTAGGPELVQRIESGGNLTTNELMRKQFAGRPLTKQEAANSHEQSLAFVNEQNAAKPFTQRYFAISNPSSLLSRFAYSTVGFTSSLQTSNLLEKAGSLLDPAQILNAIARLHPSTVHAAQAKDATNLFYGNVQFGFSDEENAIIEKDPTYTPLENGLRLSQSASRVDELVEDYGECFDSEMGDLLADGKIVRDDNANVLNDPDDNPTNDKGLCSPNNLTFGNKKYGDLVFRWRVDTSYGGTLSQLEEAETITESTTGTTAGSEFRVASYNVLGKSHTNPGPGQTKDSNAGDWDDRIPKVVENINNKDIAIIGFQELEPAQANYLDEHLPNYERSKNGKDSDGIMWRTSCESGVSCASFSKIEQGTWTTTYFGGAIEEPWVKLRDNDTSQELYVMNVHDPINRGKGSAQTRYQNALKHLEKIKELEPNAPVVLTGDFNNGFTKTDGANMPSDQKTAYCVLTSSGIMNHAYDLANNRQQKCPNPLPRGTDIDSKIDHVYVSKGLLARDYFDINKPQSGSDHVAIVADVVIPGVGGDGDGADFVIGSYNHPTRGNSQVAYEQIKSRGMDVIGMQEMGGENYFRIKSSLRGDGYGVYPNVKRGEAKSAHCSQARPIFYNTDKFEFLKGEILDFPSYEANKHGPVDAYTEPRACGNDGERTKGGGRANMPIVWLNYTVDDSNQTVIVMNTHNLASCCGGGAEAKKKRWESAKIYVEKVRELQASNPGIPIFFSGDFNEGTGVRRSGNVTYQLRHQNLLYCMFKENKLMFKALGSRDQPCQSDNEGIGQVDFVFATPGVEVKWAKEFWDPSTNDSPHPVHYGRVIVP